MGSTLRLTFLSLLFILSFFSLPLLSKSNAAEDDLDRLFNMSLEELLAIKVTVADSSSKAFSISKAPGIVTVITREEISRWGARDMVDVLRMVPGISLEHDFSTAYGIAIRGTWAAEGKVLVLLDGIELNDENYQSISFGKHLPVDIIERVEIMRGAGSVAYGGAAELGVINIITQSAKSGSSGWLSVNTQHSSRANMWNESSAFYGNKGQDFNFSVAARLGSGMRSDQIRTDIWGFDSDMAAKGNSDQESTFVNIGLTTGNFQQRLIYDSWHIVNVPNYYPDNQQDTQFDSLFYDLRHTWQAKQNLNLSPRLQFRRIESWNTVEPVGAQDLYMDSTESVTAGLTADYLWQDNQFTAGVQLERTEALNDGGQVLIEAGLPKIFRNNAFFLNALFVSSVGDFTLGARWEDNSVVGSNFVPRIAFNRTFGKYHLKLIANKAFRSPSILNLLYGQQNMQAEKTTVLEIEGGVRLANSFIAVNLFHQNLDDPIVFSFLGDENADQEYANRGSVVTRGIEVSFKHKQDWGNIDATYSYSRLIDNEVPEYRVPAVDKHLLGMADHKLTLSASVFISDKATLTTSMVHMSERYAATFADEFTFPYELTYQQLGSTRLVNLNFQYSDLYYQGLDLAATLHNAFDETYQFIQPYAGYEGQTPEASRALSLRLIYHF